MHVSLLSEIEEKKRRERNKMDELVEIKKNYLKNVIEKIEDMKVKRRELIKNNKTEEALKLQENITKIEKSLEEWINWRIRKIFLTAIWDKRKIKNLTPDESILYDDIMNAISLFMDRIHGREEVIEPKKIAVEEKKEEKSILVRVVSPHAMFALPDRNISLKKEDVLYLPEKIFKILSKKGIVEELKI